MKKRLISIVFALLMLCQLLSFSILASDVVPDENETPGFGWGNVYKVTLPTDPVGYTITGDASVNEGEDYTFTVTILEGYEKGDAFAVLANDVDVTSTGVNDVYTITEVIADQTITVEGVEEEASDLPMVGDVTNDGYVNVNDAMTLFRYAAKKPNVVIYGTNGDVTGDGYVNVNDAMTLFRYAAKKPDVTIVWGVLTPLT